MCVRVCVCARRLCVCAPVSVYVYVHNMLGMLTAARRVLKLQCMHVHSIRDAKGGENVKSTALPVIRSTRSCCEQAFISTFQSLGAIFSFLYMFVIQVVCAKEKKSQSPGLLLART